MTRGTTGITIHYRGLGKHVPGAELASEDFAAEAWEANGEGA